MRYEKGRKDASRRRILEVASDRFRSDGIAARTLTDSGIEAIEIQPKGGDGSSPLFLFVRQSGGDEPSGRRVSQRHPFRSDRVQPEPG